MKGIEVEKQTTEAVSYALRRSINLEKQTTKVVSYTLRLSEAQLILLLKKIRIEVPDNANFEFVDRDGCVVIRWSTEVIRNSDKKAL
jgi:hypothetical protein